ncbi:nucleotide-binding domain-containing protein [Hortaea werneckii]|nr:nucleotide-binding domain-containing protein [Hortaea werneckii]KAI7001719.1 nucleotide-binding domain-containing protein [Hortaea werneckii]KAI7514250.1 nucleotide-binding domain-containing protein [Hortaea werneckii]
MSGVKKCDKINIVGAGVFGLSTAIHLAQRGYQNISVFDKHPYDQSLYSYFKGADAASADINKIVRSAYGGVSIYQNLTLEAIERWKDWNAEIKSGKDLPPGFSKDENVFLPNGNLIMTDASTLPAFDQATIDSMEANGHRDTQLLTTDARHRRLAEEMGIGFALDPFQRGSKGLSTVAVIDSTGGTAVADKACRFALHKARQLGVKFVMGPKTGALDSICYDVRGLKRRVVGIRTRDQVRHDAAMTILACGGWTPSLVPELDNLCETTAGSVAIYRIPRNSALWDRLAPERFPSWQYKMRDGAEGGLYGFARDEHGWFKIGYRGTKYTNPVRQTDGHERSVPITRWSESEQLTSIPAQALKVIQQFVAKNLPELEQEGIGLATTRVCWYNDSFDNHLVIDRVPETEGLMVATAGSGHAFKYLPVIGKYVADVMEGVKTERPSIKAWKWRRLENDMQPANVLMEGSKGKRALQNVALVPDEELSPATFTAKL